METDTTEATESHAASPRDAEAAHSHPSPVKYIQIAAILAAVTVAEVAVYYLSSLKSLLVPLLLGMSAVKFFLVAMWFMHLRFDSRLFRRLFVLGIVLALLVYGVAFATIGIFR
jgi:cytochrome c oxidase subunit IV